MTTCQIRVILVDSATVAPVYWGMFIYRLHTYISDLPVTSPVRLLQTADDVAIFTALSSQLEADHKTLTFLTSLFTGLHSI